MKSAIYRKYGLITIEHIWFADKIKKGNADISFYHEMEKKYTPDHDNQIKKRAFNTAVTDLTKDEEELWSLIKKNTKYEIRRSERESIEVNSYMGHEMPDELMMAFEKTYNEMYISKHMKHTFNKKLLKSYADNDMIYYTIASAFGEPLVFHSYITDGANARFYYSCSSFREKREIAALIGRMNRYLHWRDLLELKGLGIGQYDWGGISNKTNPNSIDTFKLAFGGELKDAINYIIPNTLKGRCVCEMLDFQ